MKLIVRSETWPLAKTFSISRGHKKTAEVIVCCLEENSIWGRGEGVPYPRYGESIDQTIQAIENIRPHIESGLDVNKLRDLLPAGAARNAVDCALWDLRAKQTQTPVFKLAKFDQPKPVETAYTISLDSPKKMGAEASKNSHRPLLKLKINGNEDLERVAAVRKFAPKSILIVDANESWNENDVVLMSTEMAKLGVSLIEQPLPVGKDNLLEEIVHPVPFCADESCHTSNDLPQLVKKYDFLNVKLDKTGGLTEAIAVLEQAKKYDFGIMVGCMVSTSLSIAPATLLTTEAEYVDLDGPLLLKNDRQDGLCYRNSLLIPKFGNLWG